MKKYCRRWEAEITEKLERLKEQKGEDCVLVSEFGDVDSSLSHLSYKNDSDCEKRVMTEGLLEEHLEKLRWIQHERLVHLIVTVMVVFAELFVVFLVIVHPETNPLAAVVMLVLAVLLAFYFYHYFFLENTVQRWYKIVDELRKLK